MIIRFVLNICNNNCSDCLILLLWLEIEELNLESPEGRLFSDGLFSVPEYMHPSKLSYLWRTLRTGQKMLHIWLTSNRLRRWQWKSTSLILLSSRFLFTFMPFNRYPYPETLTFISLFYTSEPSAEGCSRAQQWQLCNPGIWTTFQSVVQCLNHWAHDKQN